MRISTMTLLALSVAVLTGCGGVVSSCSRAALKIGTGSAGKGTAILGTEEGLRGLGVSGARGLEQGAAKGAAGRAAWDAEKGYGAALQPTDDAARAADEAAAQQGAGHGSSFSDDLGEEALQQGVESLFNTGAGSGNDEER